MTREKVYFQFGFYNGSNCHTYQDNSNEKDNRHDYKDNYG